MAATVEIQTSLTGVTLTLAAFPAGSDTAALTDGELTEATNRKGLFVYSNSDLAGLHRLILFNETVPQWTAWAVFATSGTIVASETRELALLSQSLNSSGQVVASSVADKSGFSLDAEYDAAKTAAQAGDAMTLQDGAITQAKTGSDLRVKLHATQSDYPPAKPGDAMSLTSGERSALAAAVEAAILDDDDSSAVLQAIVDKIEEANPDLGELTVLAIAQAARDAVLGELLANLTTSGTVGKAIADTWGKAENLPSDPASETNVLGAIGSLNDLSPAEVQAATGDALEAYDVATAGDVPSGDDVAEKVWGAEERELTGFEFSVEAEISEETLQGITDRLEAIESKIDPNVIGAFPVPLTVKTSSGSPVAACDVVLTSSNVNMRTDVVWRGKTDVNGVVKPEATLDEGVYYGWRQKTGLIFPNPFTVTVDEDGSFAVT